MLEPTLQELLDFATYNVACLASRETLKLLIERHGADAPGVTTIFAELPFSTITGWIYWLDEVMRYSPATSALIQQCENFVEECDRMRAELRAGLLPISGLDDYAAYVAAKRAWWDTHYVPVLSASIRKILREEIDFENGE